MIRFRHWGHLKVAYVSAQTQIWLHARLDTFPVILQLLRWNKILSEVLIRLWLTSTAPAKGQGFKDNGKSKLGGKPPLTWDERQRNSPNREQVKAGMRHPFSLPPLPPQWPMMRDRPGLSPLTCLLIWPPPGVQPLIPASPQQCHVISEKKGSWKEPRSSEPRCSSCW